MSIFYIVGKPRGGKTYMAIKAVCAELADKNSNRFIVTNIKINFDDRAEKYYERRTIWQFLRRQPRVEKERTVEGLNTWVSKKASHVQGLRGRIRVLADDETGEFWLYEPGFDFLKRKTIIQNRRGSTMEVPDFSYADGTTRGDTNNGNPGVLYIIDEVHLFFPSRAWQKTGEDAMFFLSQHGKLKCDVIMVTQDPEQCDKALRRLAQEYMSVRNLSKEPIYGFRFGNLFRVNRMLNSPKSSNPYIFDSRFVAMDFKEYGGLFDTSAGVGVAGNLVPNDERRGMSLYWLLLPAGIFIFFLLHPNLVTDPLQNLMHHFLRHIATSVTGNVQGRTNFAFANHMFTSPEALARNMGALASSHRNDMPFETRTSRMSPFENYSSVKNDENNTNIVEYWCPEGWEHVHLAGWTHTPVGDEFLLDNDRKIPPELVRKVYPDYVLLFDGRKILIITQPLLGDRSSEFFGSKFYGTTNFFSRGSNVKFEENEAN